MFHYLLQIIICQLLFLLIYDILHKKDTFFNWNRIYLVVTPFLALVLPFIEIDFLNSNTAETYVTTIERTIVASASAVRFNTSIVETDTETFLSSVNWWIVLYLTGVSISFIILMLKFHKLHILRNVSNITKAYNKRIIVLPNSSHAFSFWNTIFLGDALTDEEKKNIISHELIHVHHKHTIDQVAIELLKILLWWNPLIYIYQARITLLHEYIADSLTIKKVNHRSYVEQLLNAAFQTEKITFINQFFNQSLIKKRILMLQKSQSKSIAKFKYLLLIPVLIGILTYTSCVDPDTIEQDNVSVNDKVQRIEDYQNLNIKNEPLCLNKGAKYDMKLDNYLKIQSGPNSDIIARLISIATEETIRTVVMYRSQTHFIRNIPEDVYRMDFVYGEEYTEKEKNGVCIGFFKDERLFETGQDKLDFNSVIKAEGVDVPNYSISLYKFPEEGKNETDKSTEKNLPITKNSEQKEEDKSIISTPPKKPISTKTTGGIIKKAAELKCANKVGRYNYNIDNYLKLEIGNSADVIIDVISLKTSESVRTVYIPKNTEYYIRNIPEDKYFVRIIYGEGYQETNNNGVCELSFENVKKREDGEDELDFNTVKTDIGINVPNYSLTIDIR